ncbi:MAG: SDR family oxidoreductase [Deltaproteobacteria bacterium]|nr:SDR family oxidoreductase [Deltaproteobacteria bacterium]MBW1813522.1 SDR family oxidoreductase [Deltaproteobacteria bacterium]MBW1848828.1 SDR family oxidoreductase [Deltaproteobacteria bacterium]MBW1984811.1 SDR family oxidoreductase [Deltaproteobacteria bacterium]MBW2182038.1 SDR family oxidoreductase [Deltaproteobacteria bacterium]
MKLEGKVAIVAGGGQGIGKGIVRCLAQEGADVAVVDINEETATKVAEEVTSMGRKALPVTADLTDDVHVTRTVQDTIDFYGKIDILINNVGGVSSETVPLLLESKAALEDEALPDFMVFNSEIWDQYYRLNLKSHVMLSQAVTPIFIKQKSGKIINVSSVSGRVPDPGHMPYGSMKSGDISLTWSLAKALAPYNVTVNCICPGFVYTPLWELGAAAQLDMLREAKANGQKIPAQFDNDDFESLAPRDFWLKHNVLPGTPLGREQTPEDMGRAVVFLVSEDAKNITGQTLHVDGGMTMR